MTCTNQRADTVIVLDFETTGLSPDHGERAIEIGAVKLVDGNVVETFQQLMNPGRRVPPFIEDYTGITNNMLKEAPSCGKVMRDFAHFIEGFNLVAHNASFDSKFLDSELCRVKLPQRGEFACSMLIARRVYPRAPNHKLGTLVRYKCLPCDGTFHRALADSQMTAYLWLEMLSDIQDNHVFDQVPFSVMQRLARTSKSSVSSYLDGAARELA